MLRYVVLIFALAWIVRACDVCVAGRCQRRRTLLRGFAVTDQMAFDHAHRVLYVQLESDSNVACDFNDWTIELVQTLNTSGLAVDQDTHTLYTADYTKTLYIYQRGTAVATTQLKEEADLMFFKDKLYYTMKCCRGLYHYHIESDITYTVTENLLDGYTITDFVINKHGQVYFVSDNNVNVYNGFLSWVGDWAAIEVVASKKYVLSVDKFGDVYLGDATANVIYKLDDENKLVEYAAYTGGSVSRFVFDDQNNIVFYDSESDSIGYWTSVDTECAVEPPHNTYAIKTKRSADDPCFTPMQTV